MTKFFSLSFWLCLALITSLALYSTSNRVQELSKKLRVINAKIEAEQARIHVLKAEWVYLTNPSRIEAAARKFLAMHPTALNQIAKIEDIKDILPTRAEASAKVTAEKSLLASVKSDIPVPTSTAREAKRTAYSEMSQNHINTHMIFEQMKNVPDNEMSAQSGKSLFIAKDNKIYYDRDDSQ